MSEMNKGVHSRLEVDEWPGVLLVRSLSPRFVAGPLGRAVSVQRAVPLLSPRSHVWERQRLSL